MNFSKFCTFFLTFSFLTDRVKSGRDPAFRNPIDIANKFEGDIDGYEETAPRDTKVAHWHGGVVPFNVDHELDANTIQMIYEAINAIKLKTCVKFVPLKPMHKSSILFKKGRARGGCHSKVGRQGETQEIVLEAECAGSGTILHMLMHTLGFWHENSRTDRDDYVEINWENIAEEQKKHFQKYVKPLSGQPYDVHSITHLPRFVFARNKSQPTISKKDGGTLPDWEGLSNGDVDRINFVYCQGWERNEDKCSGSRCKRSPRKDDRKKKKSRDKERRRGTAAERHHERHGHGHGASGHGHRGQHGKKETF